MKDLNLILKAIFSRIENILKGSHPCRVLSATLCNNELTVLNHGSEFFKIAI